ncbi:unnamed protein product [Calypogeia fissa]
MAGSSVEALRFCSQIFFRKDVVGVALFFFITICMNLPTPIYAQPGFLSIDCGDTRGNYTDSSNLHWVTDSGTYINSGMSFSMPTVRSNAGLSSYQSLLSFRYFPEGRNKYCYELPTYPNTSYLVRAAFYMNESVLNERQPFLFIVSINATNWFSLASGENILPDLLVTQEGIFYSAGTVMHFCLQPVVGVPFISSLELRPLEPDMYQYSGRTLQYLPLLFRYNIGASYAAPPIRYPDDKFDRIWESLPQQDYDVFPSISMSKAPDQKIRPSVYYVPPEVMRQGWLLSYPRDLLNANIFYDDPQVSLPPGAYALFVLYTEHLNASDSKLYPLNYTIDGVQGPAWNFSREASMITTPNFILSSNFINLKLDLESGARLLNGPTLNAAECYIQYNFNFSRTSPPDDEAITALKVSFNLTDWQGDPCTPVPHDWLACSLESPNFQPIRQPCFSDGTSVTQCVVQEALLQAPYYVNNVTLSNLPTNGFDLLLAAPNMSLASLKNMSIKSSGVDGKTFQFLINKFSDSTTLRVLDFSDNVIDSIPNWKNLPNLEYLDVAQNNLTDLLASPQDPPLPATLIFLDLSYNAIASLPPVWLNQTNNLVYLDLSHNKLKDDVLSLDQTLQMTSGSLKVLNVSNNNFHGTFSSSLYFSNLSQLTFADFSQNSIQGTLDLTIWYEALKNGATGNVKATATPFYQLFSFVNNNISNIVPDVKSFDSTVQNLLESQNFGGILLGGNPYCKGASLYVQRYLCRSSINETIEGDKKKANDLVLILSISGGVGVLIVLCAILASLWKLWKQVFSLREIQKALADRKVQPPFYQYSDLKLATQDFQEYSKLGHGSFGVVYKAVLVDGTMVAVKKLFLQSRREQLLDEFLNEVVLITGIKHRNLVQLKGCCIQDKQRILVYEYAEKGNLAEALWGSKIHGHLNWKQRYNVCMGVARGLAYLHEELQPSIIHRDIKAANILLDRNFKPKIADFGLARHFCDETNQTVHTEVAGTLGYFAPEYAMQGQLSNKADVYSYGIVVLEIVSGRKCIDSSLPYDERFLKNWACTLIRKGLLLDILEPGLRDCSNEVEVIRTINIALLCVQHHPEKRPSMSQVVTLLSGNMGVERFVGESSTQSMDLLVTINNDVDYSALQKLAEDSTMYPPLSLNNSQSSSTYTVTTSKAGHSIELSPVQGR